MIPPIHHSLRRESIKNAAHSDPYGVRSVRPTWFEDWKIPAQPGRDDSSSFQPMHGLKLVIKEDVMPQEQMPHFPALEKLAANGFLAVETWNNKRAVLNFKATVEIPMLGTMIESYGDTLDESHMPLGWPMSIDGAVRQFCMHKRDTIQKLNSMLAEFNLQRSSVEINCNTTLWAHNAVWNKKWMDPYPGNTLKQLWDASEHYICRKTARTREVPVEAIRMVSGLQHLPPASPPDNLFVQYLGRPQRDQAPTERSSDKKSSGRMGTNPVQKQGHCDSRQTPGRSTCPLSQGWWSDANRNRLGSATTRSAGSGRSARPVPPGDQEGLRRQKDTPDPGTNAPHDPRGCGKTRSNW